MAIAGRLPSDALAREAERELFEAFRGWRDGCAPKSSV